MMKYHCKCFDGEEESGFDAWATASVCIKIDQDGKDITHQFSDWDWHVDVPYPPEVHDVTCGCCGGPAEIIEE